MQIAFEAILEIICTMHKLRGSSTISLDLFDFIEYLVSLNCVIINHQKVGDCKCIMCIIKELTVLLSYEQV